MTELSRSLLAAAREGLAPDAAVAARVRARVVASVGAGATVTASSTTTAATTTTSLLAKLSVLVLALGVVATVVAVSGPDRRPEAPLLSAPADIDEPRADVRMPATEPAVKRAHAAPARVIAVKQVEATVEQPNTREPATLSREVEQPRPATLSREVEQPRPATLSREVELIDLAMSSLRKGNPTVALQAVRVFERETRGQGQMAEEAAAIEIEAHCRLRDDVTDKLAAFDRQWPSSAQRTRLATACFSR